MGFKEYYTHSVLIEKEINRIYLEEGIIDSVKDAVKYTKDATNAIYVVLKSLYTYDKNTKHSNAREVQDEEFKFVQEYKKMNKVQKKIYEHLLKVVKLKINIDLGRLDDIDSDQDLIVKKSHNSKLFKIIGARVLVALAMYLGIDASTEAIIEEVLGLISQYSEIISNIILAIILFKDKKEIFDKILKPIIELLKKYYNSWKKIMDRRK